MLLKDNIFWPDALSSLNVKRYYWQIFISPFTGSFLTWRYLTICNISQYLALAVLFLSMCNTPHLFIVHHTSTTCFGLGLMGHLQVYNLIMHFWSFQGNCYCHRFFRFVLNSHAHVCFSPFLVVKFVNVRNLEETRYLKLRHQYRWSYFPIKCFTTPSLIAVHFNSLQVI
jgi:hypothetical protein